MAIDVVLPTPVMNGNPSGRVPLTFMERCPIIDLVMTRIRTMLLRYLFVVVAVVLVNIYQKYADPSPACKNYVF